MPEFLVLESDETSTAQGLERMPSFMTGDAENAQQAAFLAASGHMKTIGFREARMYVYDQGKPAGEPPQVFLIEPRVWYAVKPERVGETA